MYRVELKAFIKICIHAISIKFLMYRVELKVALQYGHVSLSPTVPNVPCGVESILDEAQRLLRKMFLMYRVELKVF